MVERKRLSSEPTPDASAKKKKPRVSPVIDTRSMPKVPNIDKRAASNLIHRGRPPGARGKDIRVLSELIKFAAELNGADGKGKDGLEGWLREMCRRYPKQFLTLMGKLLPLEIKVQAMPPPIKVFEFTDDMLARFTPEQREQLERLLGGVSGNAPPMARTYNADPSEFERIIGAAAAPMNGNGASH